MKKKFYACKGFTLVELLIVIVVIGILSAMMMLSSSEATTSARAAKIIADLRNLKTAILAWYADHPDLVLTYDKKPGDNKSNEKPGAVFYNNGYNAIQNITYNGNDPLGIKKYISNGDAISFNQGPNSDPIKEGGYGVCDGGNNGGYRNSWFVGYKFTANETAVKEKLHLRAKSLGLVFSATTPNNYNTQTNKAADGVVWMRVLGEYNVQ